jgi:predicted ATP-dependent endonuclease of OLD family
MKITSATIKNYKNISELTIEPDGQSFIIAGSNASGKSSAIQALLGTLAGEKPKCVVGPDDEIAEVMVNIEGENQGFHIVARFQQDAVKGRSVGDMKIHDKDGNKMGIKAFRYLIGNATFDVDRDFLSKTKIEQVEFLKKVTGRVSEINEIDRKRKEAFDKRTTVNSRVRDIQGELKDADIDSSLKLIPIEPIKEKMNKIGEGLKNWQRISGAVDEAKLSVSAHKDNVATIDDEIAVLEQKIQNLKDRKTELAEMHKQNLDKIEKGEAWLAKNPEPSMEALSKEMDEALENNRLVEKRDAILEKHKVLKDYKSEALKLTEAIEQFDQEKKDIIASSKLPVEGLTFDDDGVYLDGLPFEQGQINTAKIQEVGFMLFRALQNNIKVMKMNMNEMDKETFGRIIKAAEESRTQIIFEKVEWNKNFDIRFVEEYLDEE